VSKGPFLRIAGRWINNQLFTGLVSPLLAAQSGEHANWRWRGVQAAIPALVGKPTKPLN
jgi:hypothetical protein